MNGLTLPNRIVLTAMVTRLSGEDGFVNQDIRERYLRFARGEPGLIVLEAMSVHGGKSGPLLRISDEFVPAGARRAGARDPRLEPVQGGAADHPLPEGGAQRVATEDRRT